MNGITFLVFGKNNGSLFLNTLNEIFLLSKNLKSDSFEIILVDDGSQDKQYQKRIKTKKIQIINLKDSVGIAGAILEGVKKSKFDNVLPIPGHDLFSSRGIANVIDLCGKGRLIIGNRNNLSEERPIIKRMASRISLRLFQNLISNSLGDIHGLILYKKKDLLQYVRYRDGHAISVRVLSRVLVEKGLIIQTYAPIKKNHKKHKAKKYPSIKSVFEVFLVLFKEAKNARDNKIITGKQN